MAGLAWRPAAAPAQTFGNATSHAAAQAMGLQLDVLPPKSPDLNGIETRHVAAACEAMTVKTAGTLPAAWRS